MTKKVGRVKKLNKAIAKERKEIEAQNNDQPKTLIFCKPNSDKLVRQLAEDFKSVMKPYTIKEASCPKSSKLKDFIDYATKIHVRQIIYFTGNTSGKKTCDWNESTKYERCGVYCHVLVLPHGPSFTYRVKNFELKRDFQTESGFWMNENWSQTPCLFRGAFEGNADHVKAATSSFQRMFPTLNVSKLRVDSVKRVACLCHQNKMKLVDDLTQQKLGEVFSFGHYFIKLENKEISKNIRKLGVGVASKNTKIPDLSNYGSIADFVNRDGTLSEYEMSDSDGEDRTIELKNSVKELPGSCGKTVTTVKEIGPSMVLQLIKIEEEINKGSLLYHRYVKRTNEEMLEIQARRDEKLKLKEKRREQQSKDVEKKQQLKEEHKKICLKGMEDKGHIKPASKEKDDEDKEIEENVGDDVEMQEEVDDIEDEDESDGIEDAKDSMDELDECGDDDSDGIEALDDDDDDDLDDDDADSDGVEEVNDSLDEADNDSDGIEAVDDSDDIDLDDEGESDNGDSESDSENVVTQKPVIGKKRPHSQTQKIDKKRKL